MFLLGDRVMEKFSPVYALSVGDDAPAAMIAQKPEKSSLDMVNTIALKKRIVSAVG